MKSPPTQFTDHEARERTLQFIAGEEPATPGRVKVQLAS
jgi:myo-inositol-1-phosphate synthase